MKKIVWLFVVFMLSAAVYAAEQPPLKLTIEVPIRTVKKDSSVGARYISFVKQDKTFPVIITNTSNKPMRIWDPMCPLGYNTLYFESIGKDGTVKLVTRLPAKDYYYAKSLIIVIPPARSYVVQVNLGEFDDSAFTKGGFSIDVKLRAVLQIDKTIEAEDMNVWTGKVASETEACTIRYTW